ncbi:Isocitrate lyase [Penicillium chermesinum]|uniref:Isocitrate lyase n=1 Tax=Penicillium chermesinum TaxID=63820 RepID=A0A9W9TA07_9EURO|nr:Isocitrate lyase [Penicillium chermesinum]KAJ5215073.1 Isocitrate lyase [Penicillium chermesinum]
MASNARLIAYDNDQSLTMCDTVTTSQEGHVATFADLDPNCADSRPEIERLALDHRDHAFIAGKNGETLQAIEDPWTAQAGLKRFDEAVDLAMTRGGGGASWKAAELKNPPALS